MNEPKSTYFSFQNGVCTVYKEKHVEKQLRQFILDKGKQSRGKWGRGRGLECNL